MPRLPLILTASLFTLATAASADPGIDITIYADNQALVQDTRQVTFTGAPQKVEFKNVSAQIRPETASLAASDMRIIEQNFDYDLLSPAKIMENAVGQTITLVRTNPATGAETREQAVVLAANGGVVLQIGSRIEVLRDDGLPVRVIFDKVPPNMRADPTLSITLQGNPGTREAALRYLTPGLGWRADYVALYDDKQGTIDVQGWVTLTNNSGTTYENARTVLVAGNPRLIGQNGGGRGYQPGHDGEGMVEAGTESGTRERLGDYYLYPLGDRTTVANLQTKQVSFLDVHGAPAQHGYEAWFGWMQTSETPISAATVYSFSNSAKGGLGDQLPAGIVRFYLRDARGQAQFIGEHAIGHTPMGSKLAISTGQAFDVKVQPVVEARTKVSDRRWKTSMRYTLSNALPKPVTVRVIQSGLWGDVRITTESAKSERRDADSVLWTVTVPANGKTDLTATFDTRY
ncbi:MULTISPECIES: DUF4139 domain-containing protein [unclassified Novosphingobium]|uniref:DUF4139 domain-containing protein n=1 Tax=unclassified Novosphingobium TaxID=2644732 RepID=UPI0025EFA432|nr:MULTISPECIES: DUF4139 domain-containing protein [unclassified Novosphingobium]HQV02763.1 DUF4139 domain-containing protein [Novosphingobium sp.]